YILNVKVTRGLAMTQGEFSHSFFFISTTLFFHKLILRSSSYALLIVLVSVGDWPWSDRRTFNDMVPKPEFNNFQILNIDSSELAKETAFTLLL
ncbi:hypothetical protein IGI04_007308, partial [Brassica rapa subsp. trilocularis]